VGGRPLLVHALLPFEVHPDVHSLTVVLPADRVEEWTDLLGSRYGLRKVRAVVAGDAHRRGSVRNGLEAVAADDASDALVAIHDGARPNPSAALLDRLFAAAAEHGAAVPALPAFDTVVETGEGDWLEQVADRSHLRLVQTPQVFRAHLLMRAHREVTDPLATDDAQLVRALGHPVRLVAGERENLKVTTRADLDLYEAVLRREARR
jgi:2-C-methyl-D-erythritol 4-phosphate cytidylyltransferase